MFIVRKVLGQNAEFCVKVYRTCTNHCAFGGSCSTACPAVIVTRYFALSVLCIGVFMDSLPNIRTSPSACDHTYIHNITYVYVQECDKSVLCPTANIFFFLIYSICG